jgi:hypothetical protein
MPQSLAGWVLMALLGLSSKPQAGTVLAKPEEADLWTTVDFRTATCGYVAPAALTFALPPGYVVRNPNHGGEAGCFWGREEDLERAFFSSRQLSFEKLEHGVFQARVTQNVSYDGAKRRFSGEEDLRQVLAEAGISHIELARRDFARHAGLVITGRRADGFELYMLYLARGSNADVLLINYRPATPPTSADFANWQRFLDQIR